MRKAGFTLLEMMIASAIVVTLFASFGTLYFGITRLIRSSYGEAVASVELRERRESILFRGPRGDGTVAWGGLLSASSANLAEDRVTYTASGVVVTDGAAKTRANEALPNVDVDSRVFTARHLYTLTLQVADAAGTRYAQRLVVPVFGYEQVRNAQHVFHDDLMP